MADMSPQGMLTEYRRQSDDQMREQARLFRQMNAGDQRELVMWMVMHLTAGLQAVHSLVEGQDTRTRSFDDIKSTTQ
jgi:hypothetical protein